MLAGYWIGGIYQKNIIIFKKTFPELTRLCYLIKNLFLLIISYIIRINRHNLHNSHPGHFLEFLLLFATLQMIEGKLLEIRSSPVTERENVYSV